MKTIFNQTIYIIICSIVVGLSFNIIRPNSIPIIAKQLEGFSENYQIGDFIIEKIELETAKKFFDDGVMFVDARDEASYNGGHITGAITSDPFDMLVNIIFDYLGFNEPIVVYCDYDECGLSEDLAYNLQAEGFSKIYVFSGGWNQWKSAKLPVDK